MRVDVITMQAVQNYGSVLQAFATQELLKEHGCDVKIINYVRENVRSENLLKTWGKGNPIKAAIMLPTIMRWKRVFGGFCNQYLNLTDIMYTTEEDFKHYPLEADIYCTGSDQVWNSKWNRGIILPLYLSFVPSDRFKFAFSASFGQAKLTQDEVDATKKYIEQYNFISVREASAKEIVEKQYGYSEATHILDPTLAHSAEFWRKYATPRKIKEDYILVYNLNRSKEFDRYAVELSKRTGLKLIRFCTRYDQFYRSGKGMLVPNVFDFVSLIDNAKYVLTDSFHATAFSMNMNTEPICVYPKEFSGRLDSFLQLTQSKQRRVEDYDDFDVVNRPVDFDKVNRILENERKKANDFVAMVLESAKQHKINRDTQGMLFKEKKTCCGCSACMNICSQGAIHMEEDEHGFLYPVVNQSKCVKCGMCNKVCDYQSNSRGNISKDAYAAVVKDETVLRNSASGGAFGAIASEVLNRGGVVFGCSMELLDGQLTPMHIKVDDVKQLPKLQGSKYAQSMIGTIYQSVQEELKQNKLVLFSGTPCQVAALSSFLGNVSYPNLLTIDIICHGVSNAKFFQGYVNELGKKVRGKVSAFQFRDKSKGWGYRGKIAYVNKKGIGKHKVIAVNESSYYKLFLKAESCRENCYSCKYACGERYSDITIGDYWGIETEHPEYLKDNGGMLDIAKGVSCILVNTENGQKYIEVIKESLNMCPSTFEKIARKNEQLNHPCKMGHDRSTILALFREHGYAAVDKWYEKQLGFKKYVYKIWNVIPPRIQKMIRAKC